jgi:sulfide:quinone oxidoreductase
MTRIIEIEPHVFVAPQLVEADFAEIAARGFVSVVNNRPDGEAEDQLSGDAAEAAARRHGLDYRYLPVMNMNVIDDDVVEAQARLMAEVEGPTLFYCRSGTRCTILWAQTAVERLGVDEVLRLAARAGFDLEGIRERLDEIADRLSAAA